MKNLKSISVVGSLLILFGFLRVTTALAVEAPSIWQVRSVDTMKFSRDKARAKKDDPTFDREIEAQVQEIQDLGANYIALGTPYDAEFLPFLHRWVRIARAHNLHIWYRGTFSGYEGWFDHSKNITPTGLLDQGKTFILRNKDLFEDGDIFDLCPECENGGYWPQPKKDKDYNQFVQTKNSVLKSAFQNINKKVIVNYPSIIGGRSKDVLTQDTFNALGNVTAIDHYAKDAQNYDDYVNYFAGDHKTRVLFSEFGAPIPDLHGKMTQESQAQFIKDVFATLYGHAGDVIGVNYWVLSGGTTSLYDDDHAPRLAVDIVKDYFRPGSISGVVKNSLGQPLGEISVRIDGHEQETTDALGRYTVAVPAGDHLLAFSSRDYSLHSKFVTVARQQRIISNPTLLPTRITLWYWIREKFQL